jgi:hypothetical protein
MSWLMCVHRQFFFFSFGQYMDAGAFAQVMTPDGW